MKYFRILLLILLVMHPGTSKSQAFRMDTLSLFSEILGEERVLLIHEPPGISTGEIVDLLVVLDGENSAYWMNNSYCRDELNMLLVVGIVNTDRRRDLLPYYHAAEFLRFLETEVLEFLDKRYSIGRRIIFGHSFGGAAVLFCLSEKGDLFDFFIASSPKPIEKGIDCAFYSCRNDAADKMKWLYLGFGEHDHRVVIRRMCELKGKLENCTLDCISWKLESFPATSHTGSAQFSLDNALKFYLVED